jgi:hypothetical protein
MSGMAMGRRFSDRKLFEVRNHIPIRSVIERLLDIPSKTVEGVFRFLCPQCGEYETSIKPQTNLARCFRCEKNFNPIDMVMAVRRTEFVETVDLLIGFKDAANPFEKLPFRKDKGLSENRPPARKSPGPPVAIGEVLAGLSEGMIYGTAGNLGKGKPEVAKTILEDDIAELEHIVSLLSQMIQRLKLSLDISR